MRIICPNCKAQYEVDAGMIPPEGRDVQCSNCAQTWLQEPQGAVAPPPPEPETEPEDKVEEADADAARTVAVDSFSVEDAASPDTGETSAAPDGEAEAGTDDEAPADLGLPRKPSEQLDDDALNLLREEARREAEARRREAETGLETQTELGLEAAVETMRKAQGEADHPTPMDRLRDDDEDDTPEPANARSDLLPDIEEINSSLRPANEHAEVQEVADPAVVERRERSGFRLGFTLVITLVALLILAYVFAPQLAEQVPQAEGLLTLYVEAANGLRDRIDALVTQLTEGGEG